MSQKLSSHKKSSHKKSLAAILIAVMLSIIVIVQLESWVKDYINQQIDALEGYGGGIEAIDIDLWRGAYEIKDITIDKDDGGLKEPFVAIDSVDLSVQWGALIHGKIVSEIEMHAPDIRFAKTQTGEGTDWLTLLQSLVPFDISRFEVMNGKVAYKDYAADPNINLYIHQLNAKITNISNVTNNQDPLPSKIAIYGSTIGKGKLSVKGGMNVLRDIPDFDLSLKIENADLPYFNDYFKKYAKLDFVEGNISVFSEVAAAEGQVTGYIKPIATKLDMVSLEQDSNPFNIIWESVASFFLEIFENQPNDQFALRIPIEGDLTAPDQEIWSGIISIFSNAFVDAFERNVDGTINLKDAIKSSQETESD